MVVAVVGLTMVATASYATVEMVTGSMAMVAGSLTIMAGSMARILNVMTH